jgi:adenylate cyclase
VIAGNIGSHSRLNYTVLGDGVNLAARFEGLTKRYGVKIVVGETTYEAVPMIEYRELDKVRAKGKTVPVRIFEPMGLKGQLSTSTSALLLQYHEALSEFRDQQWEAARQKFAYLSDHQDYARICSIYLGYIERLSKTESLVEWDGAFTLYEK